MTILSEAARARAVETGKKPEFRDVSFLPESYDKATRSIEFICSTPVQDRHGTIVKQNWRLEWFAQNPIALFGHDSRSPIGRWDVAVKGGKLRGRLYFAENDADADKYLNLAAQGILRAVSVGFIPHSYKWEKHNDVEVLVFDDNELLEVSLVSIPANPEALARELPLSPTAAPPAAAQPQPVAEERVPVDTGKASAIKLAASAEGRAQASEQRAAAAERRAQEAEAKAAKLEGDLAAEKKAREVSDAARVAAEAERDAQKKRADGLDDERIVKKVDAIIGKKFDPVHRDKLLAKCRRDEADFDEMVAMTADLPTAVGVRVVDPKDPEPSALDPKDAAKRLRSLTKARAKENKVPEHVAMSEVLREHPELRA